MKGSFIRKAVPPARMGLDGLPVWERGAEKREYPGGVESISSAGVVELIDSKPESGRFLSLDT